MAPGMFDRLKSKLKETLHIGSDDEPVSPQPSLAQPTATASATSPLTAPSTTTTAAIAQPAAVPSTQSATDSTVQPTTLFDGPAGKPSVSPAATIVNATASSLSTNSVDNPGPATIDRHAERINKFSATIYRTADDVSECNELLDGFVNDDDGCNYTATSCLNYPIDSLFNSPVDKPSASSTSGSPFNTTASNVSTNSVDNLAPAVLGRHAECTAKVQSYEEILVKVQKEWATTTPPKVGDLEHCKGDKSREMWKLVYTGLERSKNQAEFKGAVADVLQTVENVKGIVDKAVKYSPEASTVWAGACLGFEILANPLKEPGLNRKGINYVLSRMEWYWNLADLILDKNIASSSSSKLGKNLETHVVDLYKKLLLFQMRSVCLYHRHWISTLLRDAVKLDDWAEKLKEVKDAEDLIRKDFDQYNVQDMRSKLHGIEEAAKAQESTLDQIHLTLREEIRHREKREQVKKDRECLVDLLITDPQEARVELQKKRGAPLWDSYRWILAHDDYDKFTNDPSSRVLWIKGDPGKGKTMLVCGIIDDLEKAMTPLSYFLCQATEEDQSSDTAVMRGLIYFIVDHHPSLLSKVREFYDKRGKKLFDSPTLLEKVLTNMLLEPVLHDAVFIVDALDECKEGRTDLVKLITRLSTSCRAKWVVSSRDWPEINREFRGIQGLIPIALEENKEKIAEAVQSYIRTRVDELAKNWDDDEDLKTTVYDYMVANADDTFLWVALVCQRLGKSDVGKRLVLEKLKEFPKGLKDLYKLMMDRILASDDSETDRLKAVLATACTAYRSVTLKEMVTLVELMAGYDESDAKDTIGFCGSFLVYEDGVVSFVHYSAKEYLLKQRPEEIIPHRIEQQHLQMALRSLNVLEGGLKEDMYGLGSPGATVTEASRPNPDPLSPLEYSCLHWASHLLDSGLVPRQDTKTIDRVMQFFEAKFTCWLEALTLLGKLEIAAKALVNIESALGNVEAADLIEFLRDAHRFVLSHAVLIATVPLQVYSSALIFSPSGSKVRQKFERQIPKWIVCKPEMQNNWDACAQTIPLYDRSVRAVACSPDGKLVVASCAKDALVCDVDSGKCIYVLTFQDSVTSIAFSPCGTRLAVAWLQEAIILRVDTYECIQRLVDVDIYAIAFSPDGEQLATASSGEAHVWDWKTDGLVNVLQGHRSNIESVAFLPGGKLVTGSDDGTAKIWDLANSSCEQTLDQHSSSVRSVACSSDGTRLATGSRDQTAKIWRQADDTGEWICSQTLHHRQEVTTVSFSGSRILISGSIDNAIRLWDEAGVCIKTLHSHIKGTTSLSVSSTGQLLASSSADGTVKLWDMVADSSGQASEAESPRDGQDSAGALDDYVDRIISLTFSPDGKVLISHSDDGETKVWNIGPGACAPVQEAPDSYRPFFEVPTIASAWVDHIRHGQLAAMRQTDGTTAIWDMKANKRIHQLGEKNATLAAPAPSDLKGAPDAAPRHYKFGENVLIFSPDAKLLATSSKGESIRIWDTSSGECLLVLRHSQLKEPLAFSSDSRRLFTREGSKIMMRKLDFNGLDLGQTGGTSTTSHRLVTQFGILDAFVPDKFDYMTQVGWNLGLGGDWIMRGNEPMLWIPVEYRQLVMDAVRKRFAIICPSGRIATLELA
ncbi:hypothetical protein ACHAPT_006105 [Fusarium lateritium]